MEIIKSTELYNFAQNIECWRDDRCSDDPCACDSRDRCSCDWNDDNRPCSCDADH